MTSEGLRWYSSARVNRKKLGSTCARLSLSLFVGKPTATAAHAQANDLVAKGQYIFALAGGCACHSVPKEIPHAGGRAFPIPFGTVYSTNITQDKETGLGDWSERQIHDSIVKGIRPNGERLIPAMPYEAYSGMAVEDLKALVAELRLPVRDVTPLDGLTDATRGRKRYGQNQNRCVGHSRTLLTAAEDYQPGNS